MQLDGGPRDAFFGEEVCNLDSLVTLKLNDFTHLLIVDEVSVASELLKQLGQSTSSTVKMIKKPF